MDVKEAIRLLHPDTTADAIREIEYYNGFRGKEVAIKAIEEASVIACESMQKDIGVRPVDIDEETNTFCCPNCGVRIYTEYDMRDWKFCCDCRQAFLWE